jgi:predicted enzyme related to lactoylglutathione lyase
VANTFDWVEIRVRHMQGSARFYEGVFGWQVAQRETTDGFDYWIFDTGGKPRLENLGRGALWLRPEGETVGVVIYVVVDDIDATLRKVEELGGKTVAPRTPEGPSFRAYFTDPSGNLFGLWEERKGG